MDIQEKFEHWLAHAQYDLESAKANIKVGRWVYVAYMCQQSIEKLVKGLYNLYISDNVPRIHDINKLIAPFSEKLAIPISDEWKSFFDDLSLYYMD